MNTTLMTTNQFEERGPNRRTPDVTSDHIQMLMDGADTCVAFDFDCTLTIRHFYLFASNEAKWILSWPLDESLEALAEPVLAITMAQSGQTQDHIAQQVTQIFQSYAQEAGPQGPQLLAIPITPAVIATTILRQAFYAAREPSYASSDIVSTFYDVSLDDPNENYGLSINGVETRAKTILEVSQPFLRALFFGESRFAKLESMLNTLHEDRYHCKTIILSRGYDDTIHYFLKLVGLREKFDAVYGNETNNPYGKVGVLGAILENKKNVAYFDDNPQEHMQLIAGKETEQKDAYITFVKDDAIYAYRTGLAVDNQTGLTEKMIEDIPNDLARMFDIRRGGTRTRGKRRTQRKLRTHRTLCNKKTRVRKIKNRRN